jgi:hypothetical protein
MQVIKKNLENAQEIEPCLDMSPISIEETPLPNNEMIEQIISSTERPFITSTEKQTISSTEKQTISSTEKQTISSTEKPIISSTEKQIFENETNQIVLTTDNIIGTSANPSVYVELYSSVDQLDLLIEKKITQYIIQSIDPSNIVKRPELLFDQINSLMINDMQMIEKLVEGSCRILTNHFSENYEDVFALFLIKWTEYLENILGLKNKTVRENYLTQIFKILISRIEKQKTLGSTHNTDLSLITTKLSKLSILSGPIKSQSVELPCFIRAIPALYRIADEHLPEMKNNLVDCCANRIMYLLETTSPKETLELLESRSIELALEKKYYQQNIKKLFFNYMNALNTYLFDRTFEIISPKRAVNESFKTIDRSAKDWYQIVFIIHNLIKDKWASTEDVENNKKQYIECLNMIKAQLEQEIFMRDTERRLTALFPLHKIQMTEGEKLMLMRNYQSMYHKVLKHGSFIQLIVDYFKLTDKMEIV